MKCSFCGKDINDNENNRVTFSSSVDENIFICQDCVENMSIQLVEDNPDLNFGVNLEEDFGLKDTPKPKVKKSKLLPSQIKEYLDESVINQDYAKKILSVAVTNHSKLLEYNALKKDKIGIDIEKSNILLLGKTGSGKTWIIKQIAKYLKRPCVIVDASSLTKSGFVGEDVNSIIAKLYREAGEDVSKTEQGIVYIDEIDKIAARDPENAGAQGSDIGGRDVQYELLKLVEGGKVAIKTGGMLGQGSTVEIDTTNILFICGGAFTGIEKKIAERLNKSIDNGFGFTNVKSENEIQDEITYNGLIDNILPEDLSNFGIIPELLGRLPVICPLKELSIEDLENILTEPKHATFKQLKELISMYGVELEFDNDTIHTIAKLAYERKTGARALRSVCEALVDDKIFEITPKTKKIKITKEDVEKKFEYYLKKEENE